MTVKPSHTTPPPRRKILIADQEVGTTVPLKFLMEQSGYEVRVATTGEETIRVTAAYKPDLILLEAMIANPDGFEICQLIRENPDLTATRIVFVTAMVREVDMAKGMALGADGYIKKPFANAEIMDHVRKLLELADGDGSDQ
ncbi:MAG: response regulator [Desulfobacterales bacterium]|jgi:DNA-binding response OmpR family regulator